MADCMAAEITIGGPIPQALVEGLCEAIGHDGPALDWGDGNFEPKSADDIRGALTGPGLLVLRDDQAAWGKFDAIEGFCVEHGISFDRDCDGKYEYPAEHVRFRKGMSEPLEEEAIDGNAVINKSALARIRDVAKSARTEDALDKMDDIINELDAIIGPDIAELEPIVIVPEAR